LALPWAAVAAAVALYQPEPAGVVAAGVVDFLDIHSVLKPR